MAGTFDDVGSAADLSAGARHDSPARRCSAQRSEGGARVQQDAAPSLVRKSALSSVTVLTFCRTAPLPNGGHEGRDRLHQFERINRLRDVQLTPGGEDAQARARAQVGIRGHALLRVADERIVVSTTLVGTRRTGQAQHRS